MKSLLAALVLLVAPAVDAQERFRIDTVPAPSLRDNLLGDPAWRVAAIYLPPGYENNPAQRFPVLYLLHGFGGGYVPFLKRIHMDKVMDSLMTAGAIRRMIVVVPDGSNAFTGSFFRNSVVTGKWEDFIARDLVGYVDGKYRTSRNRKGRGIAGWSMGGYGALYVAVRNSEKFSAVYALSACCLDADLPKDSLWIQRGTAAIRVGSAPIAANFNASIVTALAALYTPDATHPPYFARLPWETKAGATIAIDSIARHWVDTPLEIMRRTPPRVLRTLRISFDAGNKDAFPDIPNQARELHDILARKLVPHDFEIFIGTHGDRVRERIEARLLPFFSRALK